MGAECEFWGALARAPLERARERPYEGRHRGFMPPNVHPDVFIACTIGGEGIDVTTYLSLHATIDLAGLYDLIEMGEAVRSWQDAGRKNAEEKTRR